MRAMMPPSHGIRRYGHWARLTTARSNSLEGLAQRFIADDVRAFLDKSRGGAGFARLERLTLERLGLESVLIISALLAFQFCF